MFFEMFSVVLEGFSADVELSGPPAFLGVALESVLDDVSSFLAVLGALAGFMVSLADCCYWDRLSSTVLPGGPRRRLVFDLWL